ncbi:MAG: hypothetical protein INR65_03135 [Gluconacetobacter diazotrophicus]|nr:hypothetical protein [Gluconacetobacter diazotrophicus]
MHVGDACFHGHEKRTAPDARQDRTAWEGEVYLSPAARGLLHGGMGFDVTTSRVVRSPAASRALPAPVSIPVDALVGPALLPSERG